MAKRNVDIDILKSVEEYIKKKYQNIITFKKYIYLVRMQKEQIMKIVIQMQLRLLLLIVIIIIFFDLMVELMMLTQNIDLRIEPHPIKVKRF